MNAKIWTIREVINWSSTYLKQSGSQTPRLDAELLLCYVLSCKRIDLYLDHDKPLNQNERELYRGFIKRRSAHEPVAYILGEKEFYGLPFKVNQSVLIPRPETELLVDLVLKSFAKDVVASVLDIGTGSGCIAVALKKHRPQFEVLAWDISQESLNIAKENAILNGVPIEFEYQDVFEVDLSVRELKPFDFIISNPPYIAPLEMADLSPSVLEFEPHRALFAEEGGLKFYNFFGRMGKKFLRPSGKIFLEIGHLQSSAIISVLEGCGWSDIQVYKDLNGSDRVVVATALP